MPPAPGHQGGRVAARRAAMVSTGEIKPDDAQAALAQRLDQLIGELVSATAPAKAGLLSRLLRQKAAPVRGLYIHGEVGRGKTMLMDVFFDEAPLRRKRCAHYNEFMGEVHDRVHAARQANAAAEPVAAVATAIAAETRLLCLDEFSVTDIADAMILARMFGALFASGLTLVATSNAAPEELYRDGLNRTLFLPFLAELRQACEVVELAGGTDYRLEKLTAGEVYVTPLGPAATRSLDLTFRRLTGRERGERVVLRVKGRDLVVPQATAGVARFAFRDLFRMPLAANDYLAIARAFHTVLIDDVPAIADEERDVARRLILFIDTLYDHRVNLIVSAAVEPAGLYRATDGTEAFAFRRTSSRLIEMRSAEYLGAAHRTLSEAAEADPSLAQQRQSG